MSKNHKPPRRQFTTAFKYQLLREVRQAGTPVGQVCRQHQKRCSWMTP